VAELYKARYEKSGAQAPLFLYKIIMYYYFRTGPLFCQINGPAIFVMNPLVAYIIRIIHNMKITNPRMGIRINLTSGITPSIIIAMLNAPNTTMDCQAWKRMKALSFSISRKISPLIQPKA
jgi:hypothetical protein